MARANPGIPGTRFNSWMLRNRVRLLTLNALSVVALFLVFLGTSTFKVLPADALPLISVIAAVPVVLIVLSLISGGLVPFLVSILGVVLMYHAVILPLMPSDGNDPVGLNNQRLTWIPEVEAVMDFSLGVAMVLLSTIIAFRPSMLFTRNRPVPVDEEWLNYPVWKGDNSVLANGLTEQEVPVRDMMTDQDKLLLWRYEYVLANIHGTLYVVSPKALVPSNSTALLRDKASGKLMGKARFPGYFM